MEIGDVFAINKADREGVLRTEKELQALLQISERSDGWVPLIVKTVATEEKGIGELASSIDQYREFVASNPSRFEARRSSIARSRIIEILRDRLLIAARTKGVTDEYLEGAARMVSDRTKDPYSVVDEVMSRLGL